MRIKRILFYILIFVMLIGGLMGIVKGVAPGMAWLNFRHILVLGDTFNKTTPLYAVVYGISMAVLEVISSILLLTNRRVGILFATITLSINACGCVVAIFVGDMMAIVSLLFRFLGICILQMSKGEQNGYDLARN